MDEYLEKAAREDNRLRTGEILICALTTAVSVIAGMSIAASRSILGAGLMASAVFAANIACAQYAHIISNKITVNRVIELVAPAKKRVKEGE